MICNTRKEQNIFGHTMRRGAFKNTVRIGIIIGRSRQRNDGLDINS